MFEKEAEECIDKLTKDWSDGEYSFSVEELRKAILHFAEFGYNKAFVEADKNLKAVVADFNKANEYHYVKDETPPEDVPLLCVRGGKINVLWYWNNIYHDSKCCQVKKPYAWKEIVLPKESE